SDVVNAVPINQNIVLVDIDAILRVGGIGADATDVVDAVADDFGESAAVEHFDAARAPTGVGHSIDLEVLNANVIGASEGEAGGGAILSVDFGAPLVARFEGDKLARRASAGEADNSVAALVRAAINAILDNHGIPRTDDVRRLLNSAEGLSLRAGVGVRAGGRYVDGGAGG